jgi:hypothetical protein
MIKAGDRVCIPLPSLRPSNDDEYYQFGDYRIRGSHSSGDETPVSVLRGTGHFLQSHFFKKDEQFFPMNFLL